MADRIEIPNVSPAQMDRVRAFLSKDPLEGYEGNEGTVRGPNVEVDYHYDQATGLLVVEPKQLPDQVLNGSDGRLGLRDALQYALTASRPSHCGIYVYVLTTIDNQSGGVLTYSSNELSHGTIEINAQSIQSGQSPLAFTGESGKDSALGAEGTLVYTLADGLTTLQIYYQALSVDQHAFTAGVSGGNAASYTVTPSNTGVDLDDYLYMEPTVTLTKTS